MKNRSSSYLLPASILIAAVLMSGALILNSGLGEPNNQASIAESPSTEIIEPVDGEDHILGSPDADIVIVEFSDLECPYCKNFHPVLTQVVEEYNGQVAWVYRHFPIDQLHSKARKEAEASECVADLGGNDAFWRYLDRLFAVTPSNNGLDLELLPQIAADIGLDRGKFISCLDSGKFADKVASNLQDARNSGGRGTPYSVMITSAGDYIPVNGYYSFENMKLFVDQVLASLE